MFKQLMTSLLVALVISLGSSLYAQRILKNSNGSVYRFEIVPTFQPSGPNSAFTHLWWFGDGGHQITTTPDAFHRFHNDYSVKTACTGGAAPNPNDKYKVFAISTENYGNTGPPPMLDTTEKLPVTGPSVPALQKLLQPNEFVGVRNYRNAVPGDTVYFIVTYGMPDENDTAHSEGFVILDFGDYNGEFEYVQNTYRDESFLAHRERFAPSSQDRFRWQVDGAYLLPGQERTMLLPFRYIGRETKGEITVGATYQFQVTSGPGFNNHRSNIALRFADSHDPNRIEVTPDTTDCAVGGDVLKYNVHFQNTGEGQTHYVRIDIQLDTMHDLNTFDPVGLPTGFTTANNAPLVGPSSVMNPSNTVGMISNYQIDAARRRVSIEFLNLQLTGLSDTLLPHPNSSKDMLTYTVKVKHNYTIGDPITAHAEIIFDTNHCIITDTAYTTCPNPLSAEEGGGFGNDCGPWWKCYWMYIVGGIIVLIILIIIIRRRKK